MNSMTNNAFLTSHLPQASQPDSTWADALKRRVLLRSATAIMSLGLCASALSMLTPASAQTTLGGNAKNGLSTCNFNDYGGALWNDPARWDCGRVPGVGDVAVIDGLTAILVAEVRSVGDVQLKGLASIEGATAATSSLNVVDAGTSGFSWEDSDKKIIKNITIKFNATTSPLNASSARFFVDGAIVEFNGIEGATVSNMTIKNIGNVTANGPVKVVSNSATVQLEIQDTSKFVISSTGQWSPEYDVSIGIGPAAVFEVSGVLSPLAYNLGFDNGSLSPTQFLIKPSARLNGDNSTISGNGTLLNRGKISGAWTFNVTLLHNQGVLDSYLENVNVGGDFKQSGPDAQIQIEMRDNVGLPEFGKLSVVGNVDLDYVPTIPKIVLTGGYVGALLETFNFIDATGDMIGSVDNTVTNGTTIEFTRVGLLGAYILQGKVVAAVAVAPTITSAAPANGIIGSAYSHTFTAAGTAPITWSITSGTAPTGLVLNAISGVLAGTPTATGTFVAIITATNAGGTGTQGVSITVTAQPFAYISNQSNNNVSVINTTTNTLVATVPVGDNPTGVAVHPGSARVYVANENSATVSVINTATNTVVAVVPVGSFPRGVAVLPDGSRVYVANIVGNNVSVINTATNTVVAVVPVGSSPAGIAVHPDGSRVYVTNTSSNSVSVINTATNTVLATVLVGSEPHGVAVHTDGSRVYVTNRAGGSISVLNTATNTVLATVGVGTTPNGVAVHPDGSGVYVANTGSGNVSVINTATNAVTATVGVGSAPFGVAVHPDGSRVYVANNGTNNVSVISTASNTVATTFAVGTGPIAFGVFIAALSTGTAPTITSSPSSGLTGVGYGFAFTASGTAPITWSIVGGSLPPGLVLNGGTGVISGTPTTAGSFTFTIRATNIAGQANLATGIAVTVPVSSVISLSTSELNFGNQSVGTTSAEQIVTVTNTGNGAFEVNSVTGVGDFGFASNCATVVPGAACSITVTFSPLSAGRLLGRISVNSSAQAGNSGISLSGTGVVVPRPNLIINPGSINFGDQATGSASAPQIVFLSNTGQLSLILGDIRLTGTNSPGFSLTNPPTADNPRNHPMCSTINNVAPGASCALGVVFGPTTIGANLASIVVTHNATPTGATGASSVGLRGNATPRREPIIRVSAGLSFGEQIADTSSTAQGVTVTNVGTADLTIGGFGVESRNTNTVPIDFAVAPPTSVTGSGCTAGSRLVPNASCALSVTFSPTLASTLGDKSAALVIASNAVNVTPSDIRAASVSLIGTAIAAPSPVIRLSATSVGFGTVIFPGGSASRQLTLTNVGALPLIISGTGITTNLGDYQQTNTCNRTIEPTQSCVVTIIFTPQAFSARDATLTILSNAPSSPNRLSLTGNGCALIPPTARRFFIGTSCGN